MAKRERKIPILTTPDILKEINLVRSKLAGTDRTDQVAEVEQWERDAKKALIFLSMQGHEGIQMVVGKARKEIESCNRELIGERQRDRSDADYARSRQFLFDRIDLWTWFLNLFVESEEKLREIRANLDLQKETDETRESEDY